MKNFHVPLPEELYATLRSTAERKQVPATALAREAIDVWLREQERQARHDAISRYAKELAGSDFDLDEQLEAAGVEHFLETEPKAP